MKKSLIFVYTFLLSVAFFSCNNDDSTEIIPGDDLNIIASSSNDEGIELTLKSSKEMLYEGVNNVKFDITQGELPEGGEWKIIPVMQMMMNGEPAHQHSTPLRGFDVGMSNETTGEGQILFVMPTSEMGTWTLHVSYYVNDTMEGMWMMPIEVNAIEFLLPAANYKTVIMVPIPGSDDRLVLGYNFLSGDPSVGNNDYEILAFRRTPAMMSHGRLSNEHMFETYTAYNDLTFEVTPWMPSMSHGSSNNEHPMETADGVYTGLVNFSMVGDWQLQLNVKDGEQQLIEEDGLSFYLEF
ncbi:FixH family protein [Flammeovirga yaeyamensis]|uniref:FixH family protein n=1 Tax=Flammeovirga yaeyamensis TaxID=367791 RepID=A0AAX1NAP4_9BACT|nr:FixH family protein [Flammeovirga yaeyamensis]MBB3699974.1 hypothetical protein [Flammeovirga yaeyamensis]NMF37587.1 hypothetical protein [Flammeovirga yaeyamensis]QWG04644.1 FixH family protein [Flammeovirga yaeyamensis]